MDVFFDIPGCDGYKANRLGKILGKRKRVLKPGTNNDGYHQVGISQNGIKKSMSVHRLVGFTFIPNPDNLPEIDHIDNNPKNNRVENLRWITRPDNLNRRERIVNAKCYYTNYSGFQVHYTIEGKMHTKWFMFEADAQFYVALLKAIYPRF